MSVLQQILINGKKKVQRNRSMATDSEIEQRRVKDSRNNRKYQKSK